jgi:signal transduction histidine kinase/DNA-binding response OmpR family regulator/CHASE3 domain sensor protein
MTQPASIDQEHFRNILKRNIGLPLAVGAVSAALFVGLMFFMLSSLQWVEHTERVIGNANEVSKLTSEKESGMRGYLITGEESYLQPYQIAKARSDGELEALTALVIDNAPQVGRLKRVAQLQEQWNQFAEQAIDLKRRNLEYGTLVRAGVGKGLTDEIRRELTSFSAVEQRLLQERNDAARSTTLWSIVAYLLFTLIVSGLLAFYGRRELMRLSDTYGAVLKQQADDADVLQGVAWLRSGQTRLAEQMIGQQALAPLGRSSLDFLAHYMGVAVAALYVRADTGVLQRVAAYGFSKDNEDKPQSIHDADGLVGQAAMENRVVQLDALPDNYLTVTSGLGQTSPRHVLIVPTTHDGQVNGVVELAFLRELGKRDLEFVKLIAGSIGTAIHGALVREHVQNLLAQAQQLNEELQVQQEELRTANEELEEQSRVLKESQVALENQQAELEQTNEQLAEQAVRLDQKNGALNAAQAALEERASELMRASRYKSEFLANMSHELRTPLNSSLILAKLLAENAKGNLSEEQIKFAQSIYSAGNDLLKLINDILDISKVEAGKLDLTLENVTLASLAEAARTTFSAQAQQKKLDFDVRIEAGTPAALFSDRQRIEQVLKNLLSNALKFTESGEVSLTVSGRDDGQIAFAVKDSGIGIHPDHQQLIFEAFQQADGTTSRRYGGTGLGLSISRDLATLLGGSISVQSAEGQGSTFTLLLPQKCPEALPQSAAPSPVPARAAPAPAPAAKPVYVPTFPDDRHKPRGERLLLAIEDDPAFANVLYELAHELQYACLIAHGAEDGVALALQFVPDAILLDMILPDGSGLSVLQRLKDNPRTRHIPVHVVSAQDRSDAALQLGAIGYAVKPTTREQLKEVLGKLEDKLAQKVKRVLLVEDDARQRDSVTLLIGDDDVEITAVETGAEALALLGTTIFDCMIIDLKLPDIQGTELLRRMSTEDICSFPPVIVYTGRNLTREEETELLRYSRSIIIKGARSPERLLDEVTLFLHKVESELSAERQTMLQTSRSRDRVFEGRKILVVDDDVRNIFALTSALEQKGVRVEVARNGFEAIGKLDEIDDIDLVLMDVMMPGMDGLEATRRIRRDARFQKLPIIAVTAKAMKDDQEQCLAAGTNDYLAKPLDLDRLMSLLRVWMPALERV